MDFGIALLLFIFTLAVYLSYINNVQREGKSGLDVVIKDAKAISSALVLSGYPTNWTNETVIRVGLANDHKLASTKLRAFKRLNYSITKKYFGTIYDYFVYFVDKNGEVLNINSVCGAGYPLINTSYNIRSAYYYQDDVTDFKLRDFMKDTFKADIYFDDQNNDIYGLDGLMSNISKYSFIMLEHPLMSGGDYNENYRPLNNYTARGGLLIISGELTTSQGDNLNGVEFWKKSGQSEPQRTAIVNESDEFLSLNVGDIIVFNQYYYVTNDTSLPIEQNSDDDDYNPFPAINFKRIATFNQTDDKAIAKWKYGNGTVYFFSDFDVSAFNGNFLQVVEDLTTSFIGGTCTPINISVISPKNLAKIERYLTYNSQVVKMVVYVWQ